MIDQMMSVNDIMAVLKIGKSKAYEVMNSIYPRLQSPLRVREKDFNEWLKNKMVYPVERKKRRITQ